MTKRDLLLVPQGERALVMTRSFAAPRSLVFDALTKPELLKRWPGPRAWPLVHAEVDLRVGGAYRFVARSPDGTEMGWGGVYREIVRPERIVQVERFDQAWFPGDSVVTAVLAEQDGWTTLRNTILYETREARDAVLASPMEGGVRESYERLAVLLTTLASAP